MLANWLPDRYVKKLDHGRTGVKFGKKGMVYRWLADVFDGSAAEMTSEKFMVKTRHFLRSDSKTFDKSRMKQ